MGESKYAQDIEQLKTDVAVIKALAEDRREQTKDWRKQADHKLDQIISNGKSYVTLETLSDALESHAISCPGRQPQCVKTVTETVKDNWKQATGIGVGLVAGLAVVERLLTALIQMMQELVKTLPRM